VAFLSFDAQGRDRARVEPLQIDRLAGLLAIAVSTVVDAFERLVNLRDQLALYIGGSRRTQLKN